MLINMDNPNINPSDPVMPPVSQTPLTSPIPPSEPAPDLKFPSYDSIQKVSKKKPHFLIAIIIIVAVGVGLVWYLMRSDFNFVPVQLKRPSSKAPATEANEVSNIDVGNLDAEFQGIDADLNSL